MSVIRCWICMLFSLLLVNMQSITVSGETCQAKTLLASELHYLADQCTEEMHARIASDFIALYTLYLGTIEGCDGNENCTIENFHVECGVRSITLRRRDIVNSEQASKVPLTLKFAVKVPLPSNASVIGQNQTTQQLSSKILDSLKETDRILNISGVVLEFDASKPPVARIVGLVRDRGQVLKGTKCVSCPRGYFFNATGCQPCAVDQYQDQEAQTSCVPCPSGTSTLGQVASERPEECRDNTPPSFNNTCPNNVVFYAAECLSSALLTWIEPMATDNSDQVSISYPAIRPPVNLSIGLYNVLYSAIDSSGNLANCTFIVQVARKSCPVLQPPIHGSITSLSCGTSFGSQASLACDTGYRMAGSRLRSCRADRTWSGNVTTCNIVKCPSIEAPSHGMVSPSTCKIPSGVNYQTECFFTCNVMVGYQLEGTPKVSCLENGSWSEDTTKTICRERRKPARSHQIEIISATVAGSLTLMTLIVVVFVRKRYLRSKQMTSNAVTPLPSYTTEENMAGCSRLRSPVLSALERSETLIQIENEADQDSPNCSNEALHNHLPTSFPKYITKVKATFTSTGGELCKPLNSNVRIIVPSGAIPAGINQPVFFGVFLDETTLLRDIPEAPDRTLISPLVECGPHDVHLSKPVEIIIPHCLCLSEAKKEWIIVYRCGTSAEFEGRLSWERVSNKSEKSSQSKSWFTVEKDFIRIKTTTFSLWSIFASGGPRRKRAIVFASRPDPRSDLIHLRFYVYSDNEDSQERVKLKDKERFPDSKASIEKPFRMRNNITVKLTNLEEGWELDRTRDTKIIYYERAGRNRFRCEDACEFAVKPKDGRDVNGFSGSVEFHQEGDKKKYEIQVYPGFTPLRRSSAEDGRSNTACSNTCAIAGCSTSTALGEEDEDRDSHNQEGRSSPDSSRENVSAHCDNVLISLGLSDDEPVTENLCFCIRTDVGGKWKDVLRNLSVREAIIRNLDEDNKDTSIAEQCYQGLLAWKDLFGPQEATIKKLFDALHLVGRSEALLKALREEHMPQNSDC